MDSRPLVVIADDEPAAARLVGRSLTAEGFQVALVHDGVTAIDRVWEVNPDALLLDIDMPGMSGLDVARELVGRHPARIILVSGHDTPEYVRSGLDAGADDYVRKPFSGPELAARVRAVLRRRKRLISGPVTIGDVVVDVDRGDLVRRGMPSAALSRREWLLLERLLAARGGVATHEELIDAALGPAYRGDTATLRHWIGQLRRRLRVAPGEQGPLRTVPGIGYRLVLDEVTTDGVADPPWQPQRTAASWTG